MAYNRTPFRNSCDVRLGQKQTCAAHMSMFRYVPIADIAALIGCDEYPWPSRTLNETR